MVSYASVTEQQPDLVLAARELFDAYRPWAERHRQETVVVLAYFDVRSGRDLDRARTYGIGFSRGQDGSWVMVPPEPHEPKTARKSAAQSRLERDERAEKAARACAGAWLAHLDRDRPAEAWATASARFKSKVTSEALTATATGTRERRGRVLNRRELYTIEHRRVTGFPDGAYMTFDHRSRFETGSDAVERVITMLDDDHTWRVVGYALD